MDNTGNMLPKILDCTFRDGGYYNSWHFPLSTVQAQVNILSGLGLKYFEMGFRFSELKDGLGANARTSPQYLSTIVKPAGTKFAVMSDGKDLITEIAKYGDINRLYPGHSVDPCVDLVRIAIHFEQAREIEKIVNRLENLGYCTAVNLMQISHRNTEEITEFAKIFSNTNCEYLYFADSLGAITPDEARSVSAILRENTQKKFGIHAHDNRGFALLNSLASLKEGASLADASVTGMGRGPGNTILEELLVELGHTNLEERNLSDLLDLINNYYEPLRSDSSWGKNIFYRSAALKGIHPTYVQELEKLSDLSSSQKLSTVRQLGQSQNSVSYKSSTLHETLYVSDGEFVGNIKKFEGRNLVFLGPKKDLNDFEEEINTFASINDALIIKVNMHQVAPNIHADYLLYMNWFRNTIKGVSHPPTISPFEKNCADSITFPVKYSDNYGIDGCSFKSKSQLSLTYALAFCFVSKPLSVTFVGFDGKEHDDYGELLECYQSLSKGDPNLRFFHMVSGSFGFSEEIFFYEKIE